MGDYDNRLVSDLAEAAARDAHEAVQRKMLLGPTPTTSMAISRLAWAILEAEARFRRKMIPDRTIDALVDELVADLEKKFASSSLGKLRDIIRSTGMEQAS